MTLGTDYEEQISGCNKIRDLYVSENKTICYNQSIYDDMHLEVSEYAGLTLAVRDGIALTDVQSGYDYTAIQITDNNDCK